MNRPVHQTALAARGRAALRDSGLRVTPQRAAILDLFEHRRGHWTAQAIVAALQGAEASLAVATVYNTLETFEDLGLLRRFTTPDGQTLFDRNTTHHQHALCTRCGHIQDVDVSPDTLRNVLDQATDPLDFEAHAASVWVRGLCARCR